jgi:hypothetical protein
MFAEKKQQCFSVGNLRYFGPSVVLHKGPVIIPRLVYLGSRLLGRSYRRPFPADTKGFLYYATPPGKPRIAGELRLRVVSSDDPASFASGSDLLLRNGQPWCRPLHVLPKYYTVLYEKLREERLIPDDLHAALLAIPKTFPSYSRSQFLYTLHDTFIIDFSKYGQHLCVVTEKGIELLTCIGLFSDGRAMSRQEPYIGT